MLHHLVYTSTLESLAKGAAVEVQQAELISVAIWLDHLSLDLALLHLLAKRLLITILI